MLRHRNLSDVGAIADGGERVVWSSSKYRGSVSDAEYRLSFTTGGPFVDEAIAVAQVAVVTDNWTEVRRRVVAENLVQQRMATSTVRVARELLRAAHRAPDGFVKLPAGCCRAHRLS
ncbi:BrxA family protein [Mycobacterium sp. 29Ha]|uniref:BrxA family protein n=1 Tax=Mycobacterium sp. 29Ha TaxID=2939268 RepID=UPI003977A30B